MIAVLQRVKWARVEVAGRLVGEIGPGLLALVGVAAADDEQHALALADKTVHLRIFPDAQHHMNRSLLDVGGAILAVSQFTLLADCRKGRRPSFTDAAPPERANALFERYVARLREHNLPVATGQFQAMMDVSLCNDGPVTLVLDSRHWVK
ncbi:MAG: D-aminoacyl-tRNA deacylase [Candidatus Sumerlaeia bacterium]|nr:D-aminoacyl-tRNA deacylase [Candidatus Sumerlaeia bacterium]